MHSLHNSRRVSDWPEWPECVIQIAARQLRLSIDQLASFARHGMCTARTTSLLNLRDSVRGIAAPAAVPAWGPRGAGEAGSPGISRRVDRGWRRCRRLLCLAPRAGGRRGFDFALGPRWNRNGTHRPLQVKRLNRRGRLWSFVPPGMPHLHANPGGMRIPAYQTIVLARNHRARRITVVPEASAGACSGDEPLNPWRPGRPGKVGRGGR